MLIYLVRLLLEEKETRDAQVKDTRRIIEFGVEYLAQGGNAHQRASFEFPDIESPTDDCIEDLLFQKLCIHCKCDNEWQKYCDEPGTFSVVTYKCKEY